MNDETQLRSLYDFFTKRWLLSSLALTIPAWLFLLIQIAGASLGLVSNKGSLSLLGHFLFWPIFFGSSAFAVLKSLADSYNEKAKYNGQYILKKILTCLTIAKEFKLRRFQDYISKNHGKSKLNPFGEITQPKAQIENILNHVRNAFSDIFDIDEEHIGISIIYRTDKATKWSWLFTINVSNDMTVASITKNEYSSARQIIDGKTTCVFFPDKRLGVKAKQYVNGLLDDQYDGAGSIVCRDITIGNDSERYVRAILSVTTYGQQICAADDYESINKVKTIILPHFEARLKLELSLLYIKSLSR
jgi:hypothetical protein